MWVINSISHSDGREIEQARERDGKIETERVHMCLGQPPNYLPAYDKQDITPAMMGRGVM